MATRDLTKGIATIFVTDMNRSVRFYTEVLGLRLAQRFGNHWAQVDAEQIVIGLHPATKENPAGRNGSITIGFMFTEPIEETVHTLEQHGVKFHGPIVQDNAGKVVYFEDPDGNVLYLWETAAWAEHSTSDTREHHTVG
jgi:catechol 2,3-dioxygenase-like lactoylglutathione lyase family enzyme